MDSSCSNNVRMRSIPEAFADVQRTSLFGDYGRGRRRWQLPHVLPNGRVPSRLLAL